jgi:hypothetical protein
MIPLVLVLTLAQTPRAARQHWLRWAMRSRAYRSSTSPERSHGSSAPRANATTSGSRRGTLKGLTAAREAYRDGGSAQSLAPVREAIEALARYGADRPGPAQTARLVLLGAASAAQSERDEMAIFLDEALRQESIQVAARQPGLPVVTAHEAAGDLWLQVHRFEESRRAYQDASELFGSRPRTMLGLARTAARLNDRSACLEYARLVAWWGSVSSEPAEIAEARAYLAGSICQSPQR